jgi:hypothetical protein
VKAWWRTEEEPPPQSRVGATRRPVEEELPRRASLPRLPRLRPFPRLSGPSLFVVLVAIVVVGAPALITFSVLRDVDEGGGTSGFGGGSHDGPSLVGRKPFARALEEVRRESGPEASLVALRLDPERLSAVVRRADGSRKVINVLADFDVATFPAGQGGERGLSLNRIDPGVPTRLVRAAAERLRQDPDDVSYLALSSIRSIGGGGVWSVFFQSGPPVSADLDGSNIQTPGS